MNRTGGISISSIAVWYHMKNWAPTQNDKPIKPEQCCPLVQAIALLGLLRPSLLAVRMFDNQTPYIEVVTDGRDDIVLHTVSKTHQTTLIDIPQNYHTRQRLAPTA